MEANEQRADGGGGGPIPFVFPKWVNFVPTAAALGLGGFATAVVLVIWFWGSPRHLYVGYAPEQPVPYSHKLHAGDLGMDCRYCHTAVERGPHASVPPAETCMNCHSVIRKDSPKLELVRKSYETGAGIAWVRAHKVPDFAYFDHSRHVSKGVGCVECHGRVDQMEVVKVVEPLSMSWCLDCHRAPAKALRPKTEITNMAWEAPGGNRERYGASLAQQYGVNPPLDCSGCHR